MSKVEVLTAVFLGTLVYVLISVFGGQDGLWAKRQLEVQKHEISLRAAEIIRINMDLQLEYQALKNDPEVIASFARKMGYVSDGEKLVKINGLPVKAQTVYNTGTVLKRRELVYIPEYVCKILGIIVALLMLLCFFLYRVKYGVARFFAAAAPARQVRAQNRAENRTPFGGEYIARPVHEDREDRSAREMRAAHDAYKTHPGLVGMDVACSDDTAALLEDI
jgi:cell division protein FtsB